MFLSPSLTHACQQSKDVSQLVQNVCLCHDSVEALVPGEKPQSDRGGRCKNTQLNMGAQTRGLSFYI